MIDYNFLVLREAVDKVFELRNKSLQSQQRAAKRYVARARAAPRVRAERRADGGLALAARALRQAAAHRAVRRLPRRERRGVRLHGPGVRRPGLGLRLLARLGVGVEHEELVAVLALLFLRDQRITPGQGSVPSPPTRRPPRFFLTRCHSGHLGIQPRPPHTVVVI